MCHDTKAPAFDHVMRDMHPAAGRLHVVSSAAPAPGPHPDSVHGRLLLTSSRLALCEEHVMTILTKLHGNNAARGEVAGGYSSLISTTGDLADRMDRLAGLLETINVAIA